MTELPICTLVSWKDIDRWADTLAQEVLSGSGAPETIVGLTRGGWVPSRLLADRLEVKHLAALRAQHWGVTATPNGNAEITEGLTTSVKGRKVLVVDDITDTGESLDLAMEHVRTKEPLTLESATLLHISHSTYVPTYYAEDVPKEKWAWFVFPWNYWEDIRTLVAKARPDGKTPSGVRQLLRDRCRIEVPEEDVLRAFGPA